MTSAGRGSVEWVEIMWKKRRFGEKCEWKKGGRSGIASKIREEWNCGICGNAIKSKVGIVSATPQPLNSATFGDYHFGRRRRNVTKSRRKRQFLEHGNKIRFFF